MPYCTVDEATDYLGAILDKGAWINASSEDKQSALDQATIEIDCLRLKGRKTDPGQANAFPRYPDTAVPDDVKRACAYEALEILKNRDNPRLEARRQGVKSVTLGSVSETYEGTYGHGLLSRYARQIMARYVTEVVRIR